jgi:hypothetical protein
VHISIQSSGIDIEGLSCVLLSSIGEKRTLSFSPYWKNEEAEGEWSSSTSRSVVVHFMLDQRKPVVSLPLWFSSGGGLEGSDLRRCLPEPSNAVFVLTKNNDGEGGHHAHLVRSKQDGVGTLPMLRMAGGDVLIRK